MRKVHFDGTHRVRRPADTWAVLDAVRDTYGITRVADVTGMDRLGVPVAKAVRPGARTVTVTQGGGVSALLARVSAVMKSLERWHAEYACPPARVTGTPARELGLPYDVRGLRRNAGSLLTDRTPLDWIAATDAVTGAGTLVPQDCVRVDHEAGSLWRPPLLAASTDGLAAGNSHHEAVTHALYEVVERECTAAVAAVATERRRYVDPRSVSEEPCVRLLRRLADACVWLEIVDVSGRWGLPCFVTRVWSPDHPVPAVGSGAHSNPATALCRALTESAERRLTAITRSRDDLPGARNTSGAVPHPAPHPAPSARDGRTVSWQDVAAPAIRFTEDETEALWLAGVVRRITGGSPVVVDLSTHSAFSVVKVVQVGSGSAARRGAPATGAASRRPAAPEEAG
ncbi:YcaO-like family protein [Streptomyces sp. NPDC059371]|uniref:YcaO-like family protein n=1 Tax=Streptomyces sp. NPDC059371 TaxID=3346812 RepID=UPI0036AAF4AB